jgi:DNA-binding NarL/FixJ family response regulator
LREFLRGRAERVASAWEAAQLPSTAAPNREALRRFLDLLDELERAAAAAATPAPGEPPAAAEVLLLASNASLAASVRQLLPGNHRVEVAAPAEAFGPAATRRHPDLAVACDAPAVEALRMLRELMPGLPAIVAARAGDGAAIAAAFGPDPVVVVREPASADELALTIRALLSVAGAHPQKHDEPRPSERTVELSDPRSYAHLAGLLPRALDRTVGFDVGAAVIARPFGEPIVDVHATSDVAEETLELVREHALSTFRVVAGGAQSDNAPAGPFPFRSTLHVPVATEGRVVGIVFVAALEPDAFSGDDQRVLEALAAHGSGAYRRLEASLRRLRLTPRQSQIVALIASGLSDKQVAARLGLAHRTIRTHLDRLLREHGLHSRTEVVAAWLRNQQP